MKPSLISATIIAALGGLLFGFDTAVISGTKSGLEQAFRLAETDDWLELSGSFWYGFTVASALIGTIVGAIVAGRPADAFGRRTTLVGIAVLYSVSAVGSALAWDWASFLFFRFLGGLGVGGASVVSPMYIAEISPARLRGRLVAVTQFNIVLGILLAYFSNYLVAQRDLGADEWRWMFGVEAFPAVAFFLLLFLVPRTPRWLVAQGRVDEASTVFARLGTDTNSVEEEIREVQASLDLEHHSLREPFFQSKYLKPIMLAVAIAAFNQLSGINALIYYTPFIFEMAGAGKVSALLQSVAVGTTNLVFTMMALAVIDHFGRKKLMIAGSIGYILSLGATAWAFYTYAEDFTASARAMAAAEAAKRATVLAEAVEADDSDAIEEARSAAEKAAKAAKEAKAESVRAALLDAIRAADASDATAAKEAAARATAVVEEADALVNKERLSQGSGVVLVSLLVFIASHAFGQGAVIWVFISEVFPNRVRARGQALGSFTHWFMAAAISWTFPWIADFSGGHTFTFYAAMMVLQLLWVLRIMPETKGVPLEQIQKKLGIE
ncbi:MAG: sugar porter family MFS transporter [Planctomycetota bacterium]